MDEYKGEGLRGPGWTIAGVEILRAAKEVFDEFRGGCKGGGGGANAALLAENAQLKAERYSDNAAKEQADRLLQNYLKPYGDRLATQMANESRMEAEIKCLNEKMALKEVIFEKELALARQEAKCCCEKANMRIDCLEAKLDGITKTVVPAAAVEKAA